MTSPFRADKLRDNRILKHMLKFSITFSLERGRERESEREREREGERERERRGSEFNDSFSLNRLFSFGWSFSSHFYANWPDEFF